MKIKQTINSFLYFIFKNKLYRRLILISGDVIVVPIAFTISLLLIYGKINFNLIENYILMNIIFICFNIPINIISGQYSSLTSYLGFRIFLRVVLGTSSYLGNRFCDWGSLGYDVGLGYGSCWI